MPRRMATGQLLFIGVTALTICGLLMVYSASMVAASRDADPLRFFIRQSVYAIVGYGLMIFLMFVDYRIWLTKRAILLLLLACILGLILVYFQSPVKGAHRAIRLGPVGSIQPSELTKLILFFYLASFLQRHRLEIRQSIIPLIPCLAVTGVCAGLICFEPDLGQAFCIVAIAMTLFLIAGLGWKYIISAAALSLPAFIVFIWEVEFRRQRFLDWVAALLDPLNGGYHIRQAVISIGHGGVFGTGFGQGLQKLSYLPEAPTDFIYAVIGEEFGLVGLVLVAAAFLAYLYLGIKISLRSPEPGGSYLGLAITLMIVLPAFINMSTALALIPTKGLTLPFISRGGSSLLVCLMATGILVNISSHPRTE